jgi:hypothetical protein
MINLGPNGRYSLSDAALQHILIGDISQKQEKDAYNKTILTPVIAGGLHTVKGLKNFLQLRQDIQHGLFFEPDKQETWYYARELQNGVILVKIPREGFQSKAAKITQFPETYYKSGYLWKTLFPEDYTKEIILQAIDEALHKQDREECEEGLIIGYTNNPDLFKVLKIQIQVRGTDIMSAFPTWTQPMTGNNGKPFSHIDAINTVISGSSLFFREELKSIQSIANAANETKLEALYKETPAFLIKRPKQKSADYRVEQKKLRETNLKKVAQDIKETEVDKLIELIIKDEYLRFPFITMNGFYHTSYNKITQYLKYKNAVALYQNLWESFFVINQWDLANNRKKLIPVIKRFLQTRFINTGGLDQWEIKRLSNLLLKIVHSYGSSEITEDFLTLLSTSPCRIGFYVEFNVDTFFNKDIKIIGIDDYHEKPLAVRHFLDFVTQNLGINYTYNFSDDFNQQVAIRVQEYAGKKAPQLANDCVAFAVAKDFNLFIASLNSLCETLEINKKTIAILDDILYDYHRCLATNIQRVIVKHKELFSIHPDDYVFGTPEFNLFAKAKHEYRFLSTMNQLMVEEISKKIKDKGYSDEAVRLVDKYVPMFSEVMKIPMPKSIPPYSE